MAATAIRAASSNSAATGTAISVSAPTGTTTGDVVVVSIHANGGTRTITDNNGSTPFTGDLTNYHDASGVTNTISIYSRRIVGGDPTTYNFTLSGSDRWSIAAITFSDPDPSTIYDVSPSSANATGRSGSGAATIDAPTITTINANAFHVVCGYADTSGLTVSGPVGYDLQAQPANEPQGVVTKVIASPSATGAITMTASGNSPMVGLSFAVKSAAVAGGTVTRIIANPVASISS